jgi:hypothetical protein
MGRSIFGWRITKTNKDCAQHILKTITKGTSAGTPQEKKSTFSDLLKTNDIWILVENTSLSLLSRKVTAHGWGIS